MAGQHISTCSHLFQCIASEMVHKHKYASPAQEYHEVASINVFTFKLGHHKKRIVNPQLHFKWMHKNKTVEVWWLKPWFHQRYGLCYRRENRNMSIAKNPPQGVIECGVCEPDHVSQPKHIITKTERIFEQTVAPQAGRVLSEPTHSTCMQSMMSISCVQ